MNKELALMALLGILLLTGCASEKNTAPTTEIQTTPSLVDDGITPMQESLDKLNEDLEKERPATTTVSTTLRNVGATTTTVTPTSTSSIMQPAAGDVRVEVYHFHRTQQCYSCRTVGALAEKTVNTYYQNELASGKMVYGHINIDLPENAALVKKYEAAGPSLLIGTYVDGKFTKEENVNVWYKISNEKDYLSYLKGVLDKRLKGDLT